jgi:hypothetical protein
MRLFTGTARWNGDVTAAAVPAPGDWSSCTSARGREPPRAALRGHHSLAPLTATRAASTLPLRRRASWTGRFIPSDTSLLTACAAHPTPRSGQAAHARVRELQRGPLTWSDTRAWRESTACPPTTLSHPHPTLADLTRWTGGPSCDLPTVYITSRASAGECVPPHAAPATIVTLAQRASHVPRVCTASLLHQHRRM